MPLRLCSRERASSYIREDYPYIQRGFIMPHFKVYDAIDTYFLPNNETANVYTQLFGLIAFAYFLLTVHLTPTSELINENEYKNLSLEDITTRKSYFEFSLLCVILCMLSSLIYHTFGAQNKFWHEFLTLCDWSGILVIGFGICIATDLGADFTQLIDNHAQSTVAQDILIWMTSPHHLVLVCMWILCSFGYLSVNTTSHAGRGSVFAVALVIATLPAIFLGVLVSPLRCFLAIAFSMTGVLFFATHFPEVKYRNTFDICCPSHCLWHTFYELSLIVIFDMMAILFFGQSPFTADNFARSAKFLIENFMVVLV